jgi:hypothetical protein
VGYLAVPPRNLQYVNIGLYSNPDGARKVDQNFLHWEQHTLCGQTEFFFFMEYVDELADSKVCPQPLWKHIDCHRTVATAV